MKAVGDFQILHKEATSLRIDPSFAIALGIRQGVILYGVAFTPQSLAPEGADTEARLLTLIVTPFPKSCWSRLIRLSVTIEPRPGSLFALIQAFNRLQIFPRHLEDVTGTSFPNAVASAAGLPFETDSAFAGDDPIMPSATLVLELPELTAGNVTSALHTALHNVILNPRLSAEAIPKLEAALALDSDRRVTVQWISPMATLNKLSGSSLQVEKIRVRRSSSTLTLLGSGSASLEISLQNWRHQLWKSSLLVPSSESLTGRDGTILAMASRDSDEKIIAWYFYQYAARLVVQFEVKIPALGLEHLWWEYIYNCVRTARGTVLGSASSARIGGRWGGLQCTVMFPLRESSSEAEIENIEPIMRCFRLLQGDSSSSEEFENFKIYLAQQQELIGQLILPKQARPKWKAKSLTFSSQLERLIVLDPFDNFHKPRFPGYFAENPFSFTLPLGLAEYKRLYGDSEAAEKPRTRRRLAEYVIEKLLQKPGENIAIVGAHRAGKTTVLNLVYDLLVERLAERITGSGVTLAPIRINASVTPPHMLFTSILEEMTLLKVKNEKLTDSLRRCGVRVLSLVAAVLAAVKIEVGPLTMDVKEGIDWVIDTGDQLRSLLVRLEHENKEVLPEFLRISLLALRDALQHEDHDYRLVIIMDEFSETTAWGDKRTLAVWRHAIESREFSRIKWLFSTSRKVREAVEYSPITNIFLELNVGSLREEECHGLIDAFSVRAWRSDPQGTEKIRPVITHPARMFLISVTSGLPYLLQVSCYHIYDRATRTSFPLINKELCRRTILGRVLPEMADYLEYQWMKVPERAQRFILESLPANLTSPDDFLRFFDQQWHEDLDRMPPGSLKDLERSGLRGEDGRCVAPLVAAWLLSRGMQ